MFFARCRVTRGEFNRIQSRFVGYKDTEFSDGSFNRAWLTGARFESNTFIHCDFTEASLLFSKFTGTQLHQVNFNFTLLLGASYDGEAITDDLLTRHGSLNVNTAITSIEKLRNLTINNQISREQADFFLSEIRHIFREINQYCANVQDGNTSLITPDEETNLRPLCNLSNQVTLVRAGELLTAYIKRLDDQASTAAPSFP